MRKTCSRCGERGKLHNWNLSPCATFPKEIKGRLCTRCDLDLNRYVLSFFRIRNRAQLMREYEKEVHDA